jgi:hypothetical protein
MSRPTGDFFKQTGLSYGEKRERGMDQSVKLRQLAAWYRDFAEKTANTAIWDARLRMAEDLELEAQRIERTNGLRRERNAHSRN